MLHGRHGTQSLHPQRLEHRIHRRNPAVVAALWAKVDKGEAFDLSATVHWKKMPDFGFVSGKSTHADRIRTIRFAQGRYNVMLDTHTADGLKVALEHRVPGTPMIVLETAQPAKFEETIRRRWAARRCVRRISRVSRTCRNASWSWRPMPPPSSGSSPNMCEF